MLRSPTTLASRISLAVVLSAAANPFAHAQTADPQDSPGMMQGGRGGMMQPQQQAPENLKALAPEQLVESVRYCDGTYFLTTAAGDLLEFPEFNLRFKTDASELGPEHGKPALLPAGMMGDRAFLVFSDPDEISPTVEKSCDPG